jgi:hypothetical protein
LLTHLQGLLVVCIVGAGLLLPARPAGAAPAGRPASQGYTFEECGTVETDALRTEIEALALDVFSQGSAEIDLPTIVAQAWQAEEMDRVVDESVALAVDELRSNTSYWNRFLSGWSIEQAGRFAEEIAEQAFASPTFTAALEQLAATVANQLTDELTAMTARAGSTALLCLQEYVGAQYSTTLYALFEQEIAAGMEDLDIAAAGQVDVSALDIHGKGLTGLSVIIVSQLVRRISLRMSREVGERVAGRIAGRVLGRLGSSLVPLAGWVIGAGLIIFDLVEGANGALPQIERSLTSPEIKAAIAAELATSVEEELNRELTLIAASIAGEMVEEWRLFCTRHPHLCSLPEESADFRVILDTTPVQELEALSDLVDAYMEILGRVALEDAVATGSFEQMLRAPALATAVIRQSGSTASVLPWLERAGERWPEIVESGVYGHFAPDQLNDAMLDGLLALDDPAAVEAAAALPADVLTALLDAQPGDVAEVLVALSPEEVEWLVAHAATTAGPLALLIRDLAAGTTTVETVRAAEAAATTTAAAAASAAVAQNGAPALEGASVDADAQPFNTGSVSPILLMAGLLLLVLVCTGFVILVQNSVKRNKRV